MSTKLLAALAFFSSGVIAQTVGSIDANQNVGYPPRADTQILVQNPPGTNHALLTLFQTKQPGCVHGPACPHEGAITAYAYDVTGAWKLQQGSLNWIWASNPVYPSGQSAVRVCATPVYGQEVCPVQAFSNDTITLFGDQVYPNDMQQTGKRVVKVNNGVRPMTANPGGGLLWVENGALMYMGANGTVTMVGQP